MPKERELSAIVATALLLLVSAPAPDEVNGSLCGCVCVTIAS